MVDPRDGLVVHFAPPPDPPSPVWPAAVGTADAGPHMVSGEAAEEWHLPSHGDAAASSPHDGSREPDPPSS
jgi:hypothetical protein